MAAVLVAAVLVAACGLWLIFALVVRSTFGGDSPLTPAQQTRADIGLAIAVTGVVSGVAAAVQAVRSRIVWLSLAALAGVLFLVWKILAPLSAQRPSGRVSARTKSSSWRAVQHSWASQCSA